MTWAKLDDDFPHHPKVVKAGPAASWLFITGLCYCGRYLTDGVLPKEQLRLLAAVDRPEREAAKLVEVGLWEDHGSHFLVHDYHDYNPPADKVRAKQAADRKRKRSGSRGEAPPDSMSEATTESAQEAAAPSTGIPPDRPDGFSASRTTSESKSSSSSPSEFTTDSPQPVDDDDQATQITAVEHVIRAACHLVALEELNRLRADRPDLDNPPPRSERELKWLEKATEKVWHRHNVDARRLLTDHPHWSAQELATALTPQPPTPKSNAPAHEEQTGAAQKRIREEHEARRAEDEALALAEGERRAQADELLAKMSAEDRAQLEKDLCGRFPPGTIRPVIESAMRSAVLERQAS